MAGACPMIVSISADVSVGKVVPSGVVAVTVATLVTLPVFMAVCVTV